MDKRIIKVGDCFEFCIHGPNKPSQVLYGKVKSINSDTKDFDFITLNNGKDKEETGSLYKNISIDYIRGIASYDLDEKTFLSEII